MKYLVLLLTMLLASANAQETYPETLSAEDFKHRFWQLTMVNEQDLVDIEPDHGFNFQSRNSCVRKGIERMQESLNSEFPAEADVWLGFVCEITERKD